MRAGVTAGRISMLRILFAAASLALFTPAALACDGQTGKVIFEDNFTDDAGGWQFDQNLVFKEPGVVVKAEPNMFRTNLNETFTALEGDFCATGIFPENAAQGNAGVGVVFWAKDYANWWSAVASVHGEVRLIRAVNSQLSLVWETTTTNVVKPSPRDVNSVRVVAKSGMVTVIVNGQTVKSVRAQFPSDDLKFGFIYDSGSATTPVLFTVLSYKVTSAAALGSGASLTEK
jgi:hypothetical protein